MSIVIRPYTADLVESVKQFNARLKQAGCFSDFLFFEQPSPESLPKISGRSLFEEYFLALEGGAVRGAFALKHQNFFFSGQKQCIVFYHFPLSEGIVNRAYVNVGVHMLRTALQQYPFLFALGMGGPEQPLPRMLKALGWEMALVPFYFRVGRPFRFFRGMSELRKSRFRRLLADTAAFTGLGNVAIRAAQSFRTKSHVDTNVAVTLVTEFGDWTDSVWNSCYARYAMIGDRTRDALALLYPSANKRFLRLKIESSGAAVGWMIALDTQMQNNRHFGNLRVASIVDCLSAPENAHAVIRAGTDFLLRRQVDLIISNQSHEAWTAALRDNGFLRAPSNCVFAASRKLSELLEPFALKFPHVHLNRGDGDGPIHL